MKTVKDNLVELAQQLEALLEELLTKHTSLRDLSDENFFILGYFWGELDETGARLQSRIIPIYRHFSEITRVLLHDQSQATNKELTTAHKQLGRTVYQEKSYVPTIAQVVQETKKNIQKILQLINQLYDPAEGSVIYVPDTNALLYNPTLENWEFQDTPNFTFVLTPTVLSELDYHKINHRNENVRKKAESLVRRIKEYRRRGKLSEGVPIVAGRSQLIALAVEPDMGSTLSWLDASNQDDRFLASVIEVMRLHSRSVVCLITRDINMQNKAEFALLPFAEPPEPVQGS
jgi:hypothetical protein